MAIKGLIFDMDGTLTDSQGFWRELRGKICEYFDIAIEGEVVQLVKEETPWETVREYIWENGAYAARSKSFGILPIKLCAIFIETK